MGLFSKKKKEEIPKLPDFPKLQGSDEVPTLPRLEPPKTDENSIKDAISRKELPELKEVGPVKVPEPMIKRPLVKEISKKPGEPLLTERRVRGAEPLFVRIDKFEESANLFEETKKTINEISEILRDIKEIRGKESNEFSLWEAEIQKTKQKIEKIDRELFSGV